MKLTDAITHEEVIRMNECIKAFIKAPKMSITLRETVLNGRSAVIKFSIEEEMQDGRFC